MGGEGGVRDAVLCRFFLFHDSEKHNFSFVQFMIPPLIFIFWFLIYFVLFIVGLYVSLNAIFLSLSGGLSGFAATWNGGCLCTVINRFAVWLLELHIFCPISLYLLTLYLLTPCVFFCYTFFP